VTFSQTKGLSLEEIDLLYQNTTPMRSVSYRRELKERGLHLTAATGHIETEKDRGSAEDV
jgi:hypothetical protein